MKNLFKVITFSTVITASLIIGCGNNDTTTSTDDGTSIKRTSIDGPAPTSMSLEGTTLAITPIIGTVIEDSKTTVNVASIENSVVAPKVATVIETPILTPVSSFASFAIDTKEITLMAEDDISPIDLNDSEIGKNISNNPLMGTAHNTIERIDYLINGVHPILISYNQQIKGTPEMGDGSADIGDPSHLDGVFLSISIDNGETWNNHIVSDTKDESSINVIWNNEEIAYPGHAQTPTMAIVDDKILIAWNDKYCPNNELFTNDFFVVNGVQNFIDYNKDDPENTIVAPNGKEVYQVPFSCIWTKKGTLESNGDITWQASKQLTTGIRDSNHIWLEGSEVGFAMSWQEDKEGLRTGSAEGPGEGWSGATTNHGSEIWYSSLKISDFNTDANFNYPIRITDNEKCTLGDGKPYCQYLCTTYGYQTLISNGSSSKEEKRCNSPYHDSLSLLTTALDGDTGASRPAVKILKTNKDEHVVILGYEETKGLSQTSAGVPDKIITNIEEQGKVVYFESFKFDDAANIDFSNLVSITQAAVPMVSSGRIVNLKVPKEDDSTTKIYENSRRLVIGTQIDSSTLRQEEGSPTFAFMYKQSYDTQGSSSDMFVRVNRGFTSDTFDNDIINISSQVKPNIPITTYTTANWTIDNIKDNTYDSPDENTFSPRIFLRGNNIYTGFEYTPNENYLDENNETLIPSNFHAHMCLSSSINEACIWKGPINISQVTKSTETTVDARFFGTPPASIDSEESAPNTLFVTWGNIDYDDVFKERREADLFFKRSLDNGQTWGETKKLATKEFSTIEEKEVESLASSDGKSFYNTWIQEKEGTTSSYELDSWFRRVDYMDEEEQ